MKRHLVGHLIQLRALLFEDLPEVGSPEYERFRKNLLETLRDWSKNKEQSHEPLVEHLSTRRQLPGKR